MLQDLLARYGDYVRGWLASPLDSDARLFLPWLALSLLAVVVLYAVRRPEGGFREFILPRHVWSHRDAWLDLRYFVFHSLLGKAAVSGVGVASAYLGMSLTLSSLDGVPELTLQSDMGPWAAGALIAVTYLLLTVVGDFMSFLIHYLQHRIPLLWQFHKVHHSGEVMHPISNFREHPVDNLTYGLFIYLVKGAAIGVLVNATGYMPGTVSLLGISAFVVAFNGAAYSLRHSHIWLRWPGRWSMVFGSPAHHQVHHSRHPDHLDKNFAFMFPVWDVIFGTYCMPEDGRDVEFGIVEDSSELDSCAALYTVPVRDAWRVLRGTHAPRINPALTHDYSAVKSAAAPSSAEQPG